MKKLLLASILFGSATSIVAAPFVVKDIQIEGVEAGAAQRIISTLPVKVGQKVSDSEVSRTVSQLFLSGMYNDVRASRNGDVLVLSIAPKPIIADVVLDGNKSIPDDALKQNLQANGFAAGEILDPQKLESFRASLEEHYHSVGRYNASVETIITPLANQRVEVKLKIVENDVALLKALDFEGNQSFSGSKLREQLELQTDSWWRFFGNKYDATVLEKDLETLKQFYTNRGYAKFEVVDTDVQVSDDKKEARVTIKLNEGQQYTVTSARIVGNLGGMDSELQPHLSLIRLNELFRRNDMLGVEENIKSTLGQQGYASAQVNIAPEFDEENKTIGLTFVVDAGHRYSVRQIRFEGNTVSADRTLRQEMRQQEGTWLSSQLVELGKVRLDRTGFFESVEHRTEMLNNTNDELDVIYTVKERNTGAINFGIGYGTESGFSYQAGIKQDNFLGMGSSLSLNGSRNDYGTSVNLGYNEPYFTKDGVSLGGNVFFEKYDNSKNSSTASYARTTYGLDLTLGFPVNENNSFYLGAGYTYNKLKNITPEYTRNKYRESMNFENWNFKSDDFTTMFGWNYNSLNRGYFPTQGAKASLGARVTLPGSDNKYFRVNGEWQYFYPLEREHRWVLTGRVGASYANGFGGKTLPFYQNFSAGGIGSLRGFAYGAIGPNAIYAANSCAGGKEYCLYDSDVIGGNAMATAGLELIVPTPFIDDKNQNSVRTSLFVDAASVWNTRWTAADQAYMKSAGLTNMPDYSDPSRVRASVGVSFQWHSPIGPLIFSYARPIKKYSGDEVEQFQFSIGGSL